jgi:hypothetical protein
VLDTAARHGNFRLASDVFRVLAFRNTPLQACHYEALHESYLNAGDLASAVAVLQLMARDASVTVDDGSLRALVRFLARDAPNRVPHCLALLTDASARPAMPKPKNRREDWTPRTWKPAPVLGACIEALARVRALAAAWQVYWSWDAYHSDGDAAAAFPHATDSLSIAGDTLSRFPVATSPDDLTPSIAGSGPSRLDIPPPGHAVYAALFRALAHLPPDQARVRKDQLHADARRRGYVLRDGELLRLEDVDEGEMAGIEAKESA